MSSVPPPLTSRTYPTGQPFKWTVKLLAHQAQTLLPPPTQGWTWTIFTIRIQSLTPMTDWRYLTGSRLYLQDDQGSPIREITIVSPESCVDSQPLPDMARGLNARWMGPVPVEVELSILERPYYPQPSPELVAAMNEQLNRMAEALTRYTSRLRTTLPAESMQAPLRTDSPPVQSKTDTRLKSFLRNVVEEES